VETGEQGRADEVVGADGLVRSQSTEWVLVCNSVGALRFLHSEGDCGAMKFLFFV